MNGNVVKGAVLVAIGILAAMTGKKLAEVWDKVMQLYRFIKDPNAPWAGKAIAIGALIYMISPIDAVPDITPIIGLLDDVAVITAAVTKLASELKRYKG